MTAHINVKKAGTDRFCARFFHEKMFNFQLKT